jgi:hypothetical protein
VSQARGVASKNAAANSPHPAFFLTPEISMLSTSIGREFFAAPPARTSASNTTSPCRVQVTVGSAPCPRAFAVSVSAHAIKIISALATFTLDLAFYLSSVAARA